MTITLPGATAAIDTATLIHASLRGLDALVPSLGARAAAFVIDGAGAGVLEELSKLGVGGRDALGAPGRVRVWPGEGLTDGLRNTLYRDVAPSATNIAMLVRLGKVLAAADGGMSLEKTGAPMPDWLHYLLNDALCVTCIPSHYRAEPPPRTAWTVDLLAAILRHEGLPDTMALPIVFERGALREFYHGQTYRPLLAPGALDAWLLAAPDRVAACAREMSNSGKVMLATRLGADSALAEAFAPLLAELACSDTISVRTAAAALVTASAAFAPTLAGLLASNKLEVRIEAANWLAWLGAERGRTAIPALHAALAKETRETASAAMLTALERLGEDIAPLLAPERLLAQAKKALKGKPPAGLAWFDMAQLPACRWEDGSPVPPEIIQWWVALAYKLKEPGGNPLFDRYLGLLDRASRAALGSHVLRQFIAQDTRGASHDEAVAYANGKAPQLYADYQELAQREPVWFAEKGKLTYEEVFEQCKREKLDIYLGTAINEKGILALASGMAGHEMVTAIRQYMRDHYPRRAQVEALLEAAAASDDPAAIQFVLATARRYRTRSVKEKARMLVDRIAARNGWSADELADRTVPTGGLDESGTLQLHYGSREFTVTLDAAMKIVLRNAEGKTVAALPEPRKDDDAEAIAEAKQQLTQCKKEVRQVIEQQTARLYEAMCAGRAWPLADWREYVERHPLVGRLAQRLAWMTDGGLCFRPAGDGTLVDTNDDDVALDEGATVRLAHAALLPAEQAAAWLKHFKDYKLAPLFAQMTRTLPALDLQRKGEGNSAPLEIADRQGWLSDAFTLRGAFTKLGYQRTADFEGHFFTTYHKEFPAAGIRVAIEFTGNALPEENVPAAVKTLAFQAITPRGQADSQLPLAQVPPVLLAEAYGDYHAVAASSRFDEHWQKKVPWQS
ncbi:DUF4132 domain-containing protein [Pseudoduganella albidiflava]|uniref:DUF4132 domain-containing protein n=1 Tax=Pseudoduganella albidiflava TaxID=321983 RepID=A0A411WWC3_9BURK|nr:DUF4132 domain-containing protein [Pseudoduganella albidiflava]QBI00928.1 DUF4132 domain-containing protein [Pseudoduganella albidiflava]GGY60733.1 hypothetical protein GCM10007387_49180 [Pseudoduganella albidiflava]